VQGEALLITSAQLIKDLPQSFFRRLERISKMAESRPETVLSDALRHYELTKLSDPSTIPTDELHAAVQEYYRRIAVKTSAKMTKQQRIDRARTAALARHRRNNDDRKS
jgi:hypothetical protein